MKSMKKCNCKNSGFTLIELLITIVVVGIVAIPFSLLYAQYIESFLESQDHAIALNLARFEIEKINALNYDDIPVGPPVIIYNYEGYDYDLTRIVQYEFGDDDSDESLKKVTISVTPAGTTDVVATLITFFLLGKCDFINLLLSESAK